MIQPDGHTETFEGRGFFRVYDFCQLPQGKNAVMTTWRVPFWDRVRLLLVGKIDVTIRAPSHPPIRLDVHGK